MENLAVGRSPTGAGVNFVLLWSISICQVVAVLATKFPTNSSVCNFLAHDQCIIFYIKIRTSSSQILTPTADLDVVRVSSSTDLSILII
jgi:hypothetical protein